MDRQADSRIAQISSIRRDRCANATLLVALADLPRSCAMKRCWGRLRHHALATMHVGQREVPVVHRTYRVPTVATKRSEVTSVTSSRS